MIAFRTWLARALFRCAYRAWPGRGAVDPANPTDVAMLLLMYLCRDDEVTITSTRRLGRKLRGAPYEEIRL